MVKKNRKQKQKQKQKKLPRKGPNAFQIAKNKNRRSIVGVADEIKPIAESIKQIPNPLDGGESIWHTMTGEIMMMARLHFTGSDKNQLTSIFSQLKCMAFDERWNRWLWLYQNESRHLHFRLSYDAIPEDKHPIVLGVFSASERKAEISEGRLQGNWEKNDSDNHADAQVADEDSEIRLCVSSFDRAIKAINFFDRIVPQGIGRLTHLTIRNRVFDVLPAGEIPVPDSDSHFENARMESGVREKFNGELSVVKQALSKGDPDRQVALLEQFWCNKMVHLIPEFELLPLSAYNGLDALRKGLCIRERFALLRNDAPIED